MEIYKTEDMEYACVLFTAGIKLNGVEDGLRSNKVFLFEDDGETADKIILKYLNNDLTVDAKKFYENIKQLKSLIKNASYR